MTLQANRLADTKAISESEWSSIRRQGIGGSDIGAIAGVNAWSSAIEIWLRKTGQSPEPEENAAMHFGQRLESVVADEFAERHPDWRVRRVNAVLQHPIEPIFLANIDREVYTGSDRCVLEIKTTSAWNEDEWTDSVPMHTICQAQWYLGVTGYKRAFVAALVGGNRYFEHEMERDDELIAQLQQVARDFWRHVTEGTMPPADGSDSARAAIASLHPSPIDEAITLAPDAAGLFRQYDEAAADAKAADARKKEAANRLAQLLGDYRAGTATVGDKLRKVQWSERAGAVKWSEVCRDYEITDADDYRGEPVRSLRIS